MTDCPSFHRRELGLFPVRYELCEGFIFVNLDGRAEPLAPRLEPLRKQLAEFRLAEWVTVASRDYGEMPWDWKVAQDNGDCYHHIGLHRKSVEWLWPMKKAVRSRFAVRGALSSKEDYVRAFARWYARAMTR